MNNEQEIKKLEKEIEGLETKIACIKQQIDDKVESIEKLKKETIYYINSFGDIGKISKTLGVQSIIDQMELQGHVFDSLEDAKKERDRRALLHEFNQFRDECNNGWEPNWNDSTEWKTCIYSSGSGELKNISTQTMREFVIFGYFRNVEDCLDAINKFGDRIKKLYID